MVRFDSFSKLLAAGMRMGFATGPKEILHAIDVVTAGGFLLMLVDIVPLLITGASLHSSSVSQAVAYRLCEHCESWTHLL